MRAWATLLAAALLGGCGGKPASEVGEPLRIVSLNPCADAILAEIAPERLAAVSHYSHDPQATSMDVDLARQFPATGGTVEEVLALGPDVVIASSFLAPATRAAFADLGIRVETVGIASSLEESMEQVRSLAEVAQAGPAGEALVERMQERWAEAARDGPQVSVVLWQPGGIVPGDGALVSQMMRQAGFASHSAARGLGQADYLPLEAMLADPPDLLLVAGRERSQSHAALEALPEMRVERFDPALLYCGGPTIPRALARLDEVRGK
ncbi:ABC transporter substrate-binding protein [Altererythrobacter sp. MTPC7]|uniref:ABC transporter substrate-binding protein n=1 Tax=Altererythrobacter sp. MTPC7 TaxID=3056567 RepID=UPI0036F1F759